MVEVKCTEKHAQNGYSYIKFDTDEEFGKWMKENFAKYVVWDIKCS